MSIDLHWIPLGAGGSGVVRLNGRVYERLVSWRERRAPLGLLHTALTVSVDDREHVVETMWPSPSGDPETRGVVMQAPVFTARAPDVRLFRYEVRRWLDGVLPDRSHAIGGPVRISDDPGTSRRLLDTVHRVPALVWGRDAHGVGEMWNSNSVVSWLLTRVGIDMKAVAPPVGTRAPGWGAGIAVALGPSGDGS